MRSSTPGAAGEDVKSLAYLGDFHSSQVMETAPLLGEAAIVRAARTTSDRDSILGRYSIDGDGNTTTTAYGRLAVVGGQLVWDRARD